MNRKPQTFSEEQSVKRLLSAPRRNEQNKQSEQKTNKANKKNRSRLIRQPLLAFVNRPVAVRYLVFMGFGASRRFPFRLDSVRSLARK